MKTRSTYEIKLYLGCINEETKKQFTREELIELVSVFQDGRDQMIPVCISNDISFVSGSKYREDGSKVSIINYPRIEDDIEMLEGFMKDLAAALIVAFKQNRITIVSPSRTIMLER